MLHNKNEVRARHVCFVAPFGLGQKTTIWARTLPLAKELVLRGWRATILIPPWDTPADAGKQWSDAGVQLINVRVDGGITATLYRLLHEIRLQRPDLVHIVKPRAHAGLVQWWLWHRRQFRSRLLLDIDDWEQSWADVNHYSWHVARFLAWQEEWGIRHAGGITAASRWLVERAGSYAPHTPVLYLPNGVAGAHTQAVERSPNRGSTVLFFTRFVEVTPGWLGTFAASLYEINHRMQLIVAGTPVQEGLEEPYRHAVAATAAAERVEWLGFVPADDLPSLYARTDCAIFPAAPVPLQQAKCSVRLATTLLQGVPVVASAVGEQSAYGAEGAARLVPGDGAPQAFAVAVDDVLRHPDQQAALGRLARSRLLERYAWSNLAAQLLDFYTKFTAV